MRCGWIWLEFWCLSNILGRETTKNGNDRGLQGRWNPWFPRSVAQVWTPRFLSTYSLVFGFNWKCGTFTNHVYFCHVACNFPFYPQAMRCPCQSELWPCHLRLWLTRVVTRWKTGKGGEKVDKLLGNLRSWELLLANKDPIPIHLQY